MAINSPKKEIDIPAATATRIVKAHHGENPHISYDDIYQIAWIENSLMEFSNDESVSYKIQCVYYRVIDELRRLKIYNRSGSANYRMVDIEDVINNVDDHLSPIDEAIDYLRILEMLSRIRNGRRFARKFLDEITYTESFSDLDLTPGRVSQLAAKVVTDIKNRL